MTCALDQRRNGDATKRFETPPTACATCGARQFAVCGALAEADLPGLAALSSHVRFRSGQVVSEEGAPADWVFSVVSGVISLHKALPDGRRQTTGFRFAGDFVGLSSRIVNACGAEAITDVEACRLPRPRFESYMDTHPALRRRLLSMTADELSAAHDQMLLLGRKTARERVASFLLQLADRAVSRRIPASPVVLPMRRQAIADYLGLTIETVSRTFTNLARSGVIEMIDTSTLRIASMFALRHASGCR